MNCLIDEGNSCRRPSF